MSQEWCVTWAGPHTWGTDGRCKWCNEMRQCDHGISLDEKCLECPGQHNHYGIKIKESK